MSNLQEKNFTHLHVHTEYSLLDCSAKIKELVAQTKALNMDAIAITDHGVMYGVIDFYKESKNQGIKPIIGCEIYVAKASRFDKAAKSGGKRSGADDFNYYHLVLLCENNEGYQNLVKLSSLGFVEGFYYKPRVDIEVLRTYSKGLIALSACLAGPVARPILAGDYETAKEAALLYEEIFGAGNFFLELQDHGMREQKLVNQQLLRIHKETNIPLVCTNDTHYIYKEDAKAHDILLCIQTQKTVNDADRMTYEGDQFYVKSPAEMYALFPYAQEGLENTTAIAKRCNVEFTFHELKLPKYGVPDGEEPESFLRKLCAEGLAKRYKNPSESLYERLNFEIQTIIKMGYVDYFLIVWDLIKYAKDHNISVGPGRGSAAGSIVSYCLYITDIDPIKYNLMFERFLNPERISMPDIDIDFCYERRQEVIDYVINKYGATHVAQIITFGTLAARAAIKDVGRALALPYQDVDKISKMIPFSIGITIQKAIQLNPELLKTYNSNEQIKYLIDMSMRLEGLPRHASTHAAGVVICEGAVWEYVPIGTNDGSITTQFPMNTLEELGLLKMDFLGLRTLTVIKMCLEEIERIHKIKIDLDEIDFEDEKVFQLIAAAKTEGIFQLESAGMKSFMKELRPECLEDIIAGVALYRPGPMDFIPKYVRGKNNKKNITYTHDVLKPILEPTYGCIVYQEQVMQIVRDLAGYSLGRSDLVRRAMSKKKADVMQKERQNFVYGNEAEIVGCVKNGIPAQTAEKIFDEITDFAKYAFNKSHAAAYAVITYETAWLKTYYPVEFMAALMTSVMDHASKVTEYIDTCKRMDVELLPPDINEGYPHFSVNGNKIRFGLLAIKNVGKNVIKNLVEEREKGGRFLSMSDFLNRMNAKDLNKKCIESLIKAGAFDSLGGFRSQYMHSFGQILEGINHFKKSSLAGQLNLFDMDDSIDNSYKEDNLPTREEYPQKEMLIMEKEVLGIYISGHPLAEYEDILKRHVTAYSLDFISEDSGTPCKLADGQKVKIGGQISQKSIKYTKNNKTMAFITLEDVYDSLEVVVFSNTYAKYSPLLNKEAVVMVEGRVSISADGEIKLICEKVFDINHIKEENRISIGITIPPDRGENCMDMLSGILKQYSGSNPVYINDEKKQKVFKANKNLWVRNDEMLFEELKKVIGNENLKIKLLGPL